MSIWQDLIQRGRPAPEHICTSCKGKYRLSESTQFCPHCGHPSPRYYEETGGLTLDQQRTLIGGGLIVLLVAGGAGLYWNLQSADEDIGYRLLGRTDVTWTVETRLPRPDGSGLRVAGRTTYFSRPGYLRVDFEEAGQPAHHALTRIADFASHQLATVDTATSLMYSESLGPDTLGQRLYADMLKTAALPATALPGTALPAMALPAPVLTSADLPPMASPAPGSRLALFDPSRPVNLEWVQAGNPGPEAGSSATPAAPALGASRTMHLENLGRESISGYRCTHYRLTATVINLKCSNLASGAQTVELWIADRAAAVPLYPTPTPDSASSHSTGGKPQGDSVEDSVAAPTPTAAANPDATATAPSAKAAMDAPSGGGAGSAAPGPTPLPFPTPYAGPGAAAVLTDIANVDPARAACNMEDIPKGRPRDFTNLYRGLIMRYRAFRGTALVLEQEVTRVRHREIALDEVSTGKYQDVSTDEFWTKRNAELANPTVGRTAPTP